MTIGTPVLVGSATSTTSNTTLAITTTQDCAAGGTILLLAASSSTALPASAVDSASNTYAVGQSRASSGGHIGGGEVLAKNCAFLASGSTITITFGASNASKGGLAIYIPNADPNPVDIDILPGRSNAITAISLTTAALAQADESAIGWVGVQSTGQSDGFTEATGAWATLGSAGPAGANVIRAAWVNPNATTALTYNPTLGTSREAVWNVITFKGASASAPFAPANLPNPRPAAASDRSFSAPLALALVAAISAAPPFVPGDFPNPQVRTARLPPPVGDDASPLYLLASTGIPFVPVLFPNPQVAGRLTPPAGETAQPILLAAGFSATTVLRGPLVTRIVGPDRRVAVSAQDWTVSLDLSLLFPPAGAAPFLQSDWPNPQGYRQPWANKTHLGPMVLNLRGQDSFFGGPGAGPDYDWPNPRGYGRLTPEVGPPASLPLLTVVTAAPFYFTGWTNPPGYPIPLANRTHAASLALNLRGQDAFFGLAGSPNFDWPNPLVKGRNLPPVGEPSRAALYTTPAPFLQSHWPNPLGYLQPWANKTHTANLRLNLLGQDRMFGAAGQVPAYDWQNPRLPGRLLPDVGARAIYLPSVTASLSVTLDDVVLTALARFTITGKTSAQAITVSGHAADQTLSVTGKSATSPLTGVVGKTAARDA